VLKIGLLNPMKIPVIREYYKKGLRIGFREGFCKGLGKAILMIISNKFGKKECNEIKNTITDIDEIDKLDQILRMTMEFDNFDEFKDKLQIIIK